MRFLVRAEVGPVPSDELGALLERIEREWEMVLHLAENGPIVACGKLVGRRGAVAIFETENRQSLDVVIALLPLAPYFARLDIEPLESAETALAKARRQRRSYELLRARANGTGTARRGVEPTR